MYKVMLLRFEHEAYVKLQIPVPELSANSID